LHHCARCRAIVARVGGGGRVSDDVTEPEQARAAGPPPKQGGVWTFWAPSVDEYLVGAVLDAGESDVLIVPLLENTSWPADADVAFTQDILGYPALAPVWAGDHILIEQAAEPVGMLSEERLAHLLDAYDAFFAGEALSDPAGPPVLADTDPRVNAHAAIADDLRPFYTPWSLLQIADELGPVLRHRRDEIGIGLGTWTEQIDVDPRAWEAFEAAEADPYENVPVTALVKAVRKLGLLASRRVLDLAGESVRAHHRPAAEAAHRAKARRRSGIVPQRRADPDEANAAAERYTSELAKALGL
jgi:hypothetical protein